MKLTGRTDWYGAPSVEEIHGKGYVQNIALGNKTPIDVGRQSTLITERVVQYIPTVLDSEDKTS